MNNTIRYLRLKIIIIIMDKTKVSDTNCIIYNYIYIKTGVKLLYTSQNHTKIIIIL